MGIVPFLRHILFPPGIVNGSETLPPAKPVCLPYSTFDKARVSHMFFFSSSRLASKFMAQLAYALLSALSLR